VDINGELTSAAFSSVEVSGFVLVCFDGDENFRFGAFRVRQPVNVFDEQRSRKTGGFIALMLFKRRF
jgi:hypothetical protein